MAALYSTDKQFPKSLLSIRPLVKRLYLKGQQISGTYWSDRTIAIVGSRKMTRYGQQVIEELVPPLVQAGVTIISGFMYGVDQYVHHLCLENGGFTVAVLGWGIDWEVLPVERQLYRQIEHQGLLLSEYQADTKPQLWMFPARDRIMAGLSQATLVIEAAERSGSLITANFAKRYKRKLFCVPGPITSSVSKGTNRLIKVGTALMVESAQEILNVMSWPAVFLQKDDDLLQKTHPAISFLANEALTIDELAQKCQQSVAQISADLSVLQIKGLIYEDNGKYFLKQLC